MLTQAKVVSACGVTHKFIHTLEPEHEGTSPALYTRELGAGSIGHPETLRFSNQREDIAKAMWLNYQKELQERGQF